MSSSSLPILSYDDWRIASDELLLQEKQITAMRDAVNEKRRQLGGYILSPQQISSWSFMNATTGKCHTLYDLFGSTHNKLLIYHCMSFKHYPCGACAYVIKQFDAVYQALNAHTATVVIARAPPSSMKKVQTELGWTVPCYTCDSMDFSNQFHTERTKDTEDGPKGYFGSIPGLSSLYYDRTNNNILHHYSSFNRGVEDVENYFAWLDRIPLNPLTKHAERKHPKTPLPKDEDVSAMQEEMCCNEKAKVPTDESCCNNNSSSPSQQHINLDTNGKVLHFNNIHYIYYESHGDFSVICRDTWMKVHAQLHHIRSLPNVKITGALSLYKPKEGIYRAGVSIDQPLPSPPANFKYELMPGSSYMNYRLTGAYSQLPVACGMVASLVEKNHINVRKGGWHIENYLNDPKTTPEAELLTDIMVPINEQSSSQSQQSINLDTTGKLLQFPNIHYIYYESQGDFSVICRDTWMKVGTQLQHIKSLPNIKITGALSLYKPKEGIYRAGVSIDQPLPSPPANFKYEYVPGSSYMNYRLTGSYSQMPAACGMVASLVEKNHVNVRKDGWYIENYLNDPKETPEAELLTDLMVPIISNKDEHKQ